MINNNNNVLKEDKMKTKIKKQYVLCFLHQKPVLTDARLESYGVGVEADETFTFEVIGKFHSELDALQKLQSIGQSNYEYTIIEKLKVVEE